MSTPRPMIPGFQAIAGLSVSQAGQFPEIKENKELAYQNAKRKEEKNPAVNECVKAYYKAMDDYIAQEKGRDPNLTFDDIIASDGAKKIIAEHNKEKTSGNAKITLFINDNGVISARMFTSTSTSTSNVTSTSTSKTSFKVKLF